MQVSLGGVYFATMLFLGSFLGSVFMLGPFLPLLLVNPPWYRWLTDRIVATWLTLPVALLELVFGVKVVVTGDGFRPGERSVIIMNHRTRLDWMFLWNCLLRSSYLRLEKICLKSTLKHVPGFANTKARSDQFAEKNGLPKYEHVLHPRTTGFTHIVQRLHSGGKLDCVHDVTVAYPCSFPQNELQLLAGRFPHEIHFHVRRHPVSTLPLDSAGLAAWCCDRWLDKEAMLRSFYERGSFVVPATEPSPTTASSNGAVVAAAPMEPPVPQCKSELRVRCVQWLSLVWWTVFTCVAAPALLYSSAVARAYFVVACTFFALQARVAGGLEKLEVAWFPHWQRLSGYGAVASRVS
uniref:Lysocardiolipin acyltransferase 1 isoform X2 n=1 Tax=Petromyzon marinus TaxID=7757 RepID=A0AAJ7TMW3_PETMA|nr:lysocardiolipin acyltransferase 1 isoform X2 [Petromyzon marinus]